jgi:hypothetical protein
VAFALIAGNPLNVLAGGLVIDTDYANAAAAFELFVKDRWHWPLGANPHFGGVNIFFSDGGPWLAMLAKLVLQVSGVFINFHWLTLINVMMFAVMARRLSCLLTKQLWVSWLITLCLLFSLMMPVRMIGGQHIALSSYWVVLWAMCCVPLGAEALSFRRRWEFVVALTFAVWSHAYLAAMALTLVGALLLSEKRWKATLLALGVALFLLYIVGVFHGEHAITEGAKAYSLDVLAFAESLGWALLPNLYTIKTPTQSDAILYLGTGVWSLLVVSAVLAVVQLLRGRLALSLPQGDAGKFWQHGSVTKRLGVLILASLALAIYSMTFDLRVAGHVLVSLDIPSVFEPLYHRFRVTGRFATPLAFCMIIVACLVWAKLSQGGPRFAVFSVAMVVVSLQMADVWVAGKKSPPDVWLADAQEQRTTVASVAEEDAWSGRVFRAVGYFDLEQQRMIDLALVEQGAWYFAVAHGARLSPEDVERRSGFSEAASGDIAITLTDADAQPECSKRSTIKNYTLCLVR